jgi:hypothetical protein
MQKKAVATTKKVATKKVVKKAAPKAKKTNSKKTLVYADNNHSFWVNDGRILNSLLALNEAMASMEKAVFAHHVTKDKHDFADWVDSVLCDDTCAVELRKAKTPTTAKTVVAKHLKTYQI